MASKKLTEDQIELVKQSVRSHDFTWWMNKTKLVMAKDELTKSVGFKVPVKVFKAIREEVCQWFKVQERPAPSPNTRLSGEQWDALRKAVRANEEILRGRSLGEAVAIVSLTVRCNAKTLSGITKELRYWEQKV